MKNNLKVALVQADLVWENPEKNRLNFTDKIHNLRESVDLIVLPEMFNSGFTMNPTPVAETMEGESIVWLKTLAHDKNAAITGSLIIKEKGHYFNRLIFVEPSGKLSFYNKRHTFTLAGEDKVYTAGNEKKIITYLGWKICPLICYDLRFPVWARNVEDYDVLIYVANWPKPRINAWDALLKARAIENMSYCIGVNRVGLDSNNHEYPGHSACYDVLGNRMDSMSQNKEVTEIVELEIAHIKNYRLKLNFLEDKDLFSLKE